ncbi:MAG: N-6 DNA methylase [Chloroflexota bacterium]|nr:N-6 DNA methylase [Chloroflexota bacterium]
MSAVRDYLTEIQAEYKTNVAREHAYRPALKTLLESADINLQAVNDPKRTEIGMPDYVVYRQPGNIPIGIVEAKDIGNQLSRTERSAQIKRYMAQGNLILTNYLEFRWYVNGEKLETVRIARVKNGKITRISNAYGKLTDMLRRFVQQTTQSVNSAQELAERLARSAQFIAHFIERDLKSSEPSANLKSQMAAFQKTLLPGLDVPRFADMYAQTLAYGLFASRVNFPGEPSQFNLRGAADDIPKTNPFLRDLFYHSRFDFGRRLTWMAESLVEILRHTDMDSILKDFGKRTQQTDPVLHFYETFLSAYNPQLRERRGVYYTPEPVVSYIVRSVDHILKTRFDRPDGLADKDTLILDPAAGTGTFLYFVIQQIFESFAGQRGRWKGYVQEHLLPRLFGFELLMAPYTVAHMKLGLQLREAGYDFKEGERLGIYLTNSLEEAKEAPELPFAEFIAEEANSAAEIKRDKPIMVVLGNPPYSGHSANKGEWIGKLVRDYYFVDGDPIGERNPKWLQDDYVKFIRFGQWRIERSSSGIVAFITNNSYLDAPTFRGMRSSLLKSFDRIYVLNLHGSSKRMSNRDGQREENVFDIQQGVSIVILIKEYTASTKPAVFYCDLQGPRSTKYSWLQQHEIHDSDWQTIVPKAPYYFFVMTDTEYEIEYLELNRITDVMPVNSVGIVTGQDRKVISMNRKDILQRAQANSIKKDHIEKINYRVFDSRYILYHEDYVTRMRQDVMNHMLSGSEFSLICTRQQSQTATWALIGVSERIIESCFLSNKTREINYLLPLYVYPKPNQFDAGDDISEYPLSDKGRRPNLSKAFVSEMEAKLGLRFVTEGSAFAPHPPAPSPTRREGELGLSELVKGDESPLPHLGGGGLGVFGPEDVFYYAYAVFHSPTYRERYAEFLKIDFPRLPLTADVDLFAALVKLGAELVSLHLMKSLTLSKFITTFDTEGDNEVARGYPKYNEVKRSVAINKSQYFGGVSPDVWDFHIGGYRVADKWLKDRRGRILSDDDLEHYQRIIVALTETMRIMSEIDDAIPGFPIG